MASSSSIVYKLHMCWLVALSVLAIQRPLSRSQVRAAPVDVAAGFTGLKMSGDVPCERGKPVDLTSLWPGQINRSNLDCYRCFCNPKGVIACTDVIIGHCKDTRRNKLSGAPRSATTRSIPVTTTPLPSELDETYTTTRKPPKKYTIPANYIDWQNTIRLAGTTFELGGGIKTPADELKYIKIAAEVFNTTTEQYLAKRNYYKQLIADRTSTTSTTSTTTTTTTTTTPRPRPTQRTTPSTTTTSTTTSEPTFITHQEQFGEVDGWFIIPGLIIGSLLLLLFILLILLLRLTMHKPEKSFHHSQASQICLT